MIKRVLLATSALVLLAGMAAAEVVLNRGNDSDPSSLDHHRTSTVSEGRILKDLYEGLTTHDAEGKIIPGAAESWEVSEDGLVYTFRLRRDGKWSNGDPVVADDFVYAFRRLVNPMTAARYATLHYVIKNAKKVALGELPVEEHGIRAVDDYTVEITLEAPTAFFLELLAHQSAMPLHRATVEANGDRFTQPGTLVTNGAYMLESFVPNDRLVMVKNPHFHDAANVQIDRVIYYPFEDRAACMRRFQAKEVQICADVPAEQMDYLRNNMADSLHLAPYLGTYYLPVKGPEGSPLKDKRVRQAISLVIDREFIAESVFKETMRPSYSLVPDSVPFVDPRPELGYSDKDMLEREDMARELLQEAGVAEGSLSVKLLYNTSENNKNTMSAVASALNALGIRAQLEEAESTTYFNYLQEGGAFDIARAGWIGDYPDPQTFLFLFEKGSYFNYSNWENDQFDALLTQAGRTVDKEERLELLAQAERIFLDELPAIPILSYISRALVSPAVGGYIDNVTDDHGSRWLTYNP